MKNQNTKKALINAGNFLITNKKLIAAGTALGLALYNKCVRDQNMDKVQVERKREIIDSLITLCKELFDVE